MTVQASVLSKPQGQGLWPLLLALGLMKPLSWKRTYLKVSAECYLWGFHFEVKP